MRADAGSTRYVWKTTALLVAVVVATGCGGGGEGSAAPSREPTSTSTTSTIEPPDSEGLDDPGEDIALEGSVTVGDEAFVEYPDGLIVRVVRVDTPDRSLGVDVPADMSLVRVTVSLENTGTSPVELGDGVRRLDILYGENRYEADMEAGYASDDPAKQMSSKDPERLVPGSTIEIFETSVVPTADLDELAVTVNIARGHYTPFTFTDIETLIEHT